MIEQRPYLYQITAGEFSNVADSGCPSMEPSAEELAQRTADVCTVEGRTLETATDAFYATFRRYPASMDELVEAGYLREALDAWEVRATNEGGLWISALRGGRCDLAE